MEDTYSNDQHEQIEATLFGAPVVVTPMAFDDAPVRTTAEYTKQLVEKVDGANDTNAKMILVYLDEIDIASSIHGADVRIRQLTQKIRSAVKGE